MKPRRSRIVAQRARDFPQAAGQATVACCSTTCCFTILGGGVGLLAGGVLGIVAYCKNRQQAHVLVHVVAGFCWCVGYALLGLVIGAGLGLVTDLLINR